MVPSKAPVKIGCCGFRSSRESYYPLLPAVEVQHTFYQPPQLATLAKWRKEAPADFEFTIKAWQLITHQSSSPTYRRLKRELTSSEKEGNGRGGWRYSYEDAELEELCSMLPEDAESYVFFNNIHMKMDALRFKEIVQAER